MTGTYYGSKIIGTPHHIEMFYDRSIRIWYTFVCDKNGDILILEPKTGASRSFAEDAGCKENALVDAKELSKLLKIPIQKGKK
jgi:hypothetical protein